jgi:hypothetical protein
VENNKANIKIQVYQNRFKLTILFPPFFQDFNLATLSWDIKIVDFAQPDSLIKLLMFFKCKTFTKSNENIWKH